MTEPCSYVCYSASTISSQFAVVVVALKLKLVDALQPSVGLPFDCCLLGEFSMILITFLQLTSLYLLYGPTKRLLRHTLHNNLAF